ncbi:MAG TPA: PhzF family phenazine biosynthesis protein [Rhodothermales bacterium]|nr:PhzF family phenazine biosynthesis protein [Rhodothermales bacterium]
MPIQIIQVDAFTDSPFAGNPAAVCILPGWREETWLQAVAREMNLSETAFLVPRPDHDFDLRWFTPAVEVDLCGHATLASAHVLWSTRVLKPKSEARFHTRSGLLTARKSRKWIILDFPAAPPEKAALPPALVQALGAVPVYCGKNRFDYIVDVDSEAVVRSLEPDLNLLATLECRGVIVTARSKMKGVDFVSRFFGPRVGISEDPVTGSAHCCLGPYWQKRLRKKQLVGYQASDRGGTVRVELDGSRVKLSGQAVTVLEARLVAEG